MIDGSKIPAELRQLPQWVLWATVVRDGLATKLPYQSGGALAKSNDPTSWGSFAGIEQELDWAGKRYSGLGFVFAKSDEFCGIDLDGCRNALRGEMAPWAKQIIQDLNSYSEVSPSGTGVKIFLRGKLPMPTGKKKAIDQPAFWGKQPAIEVYDHSRYFAVTGQRLAGVSHICEPRQGQLDELVSRHFPTECLVIAPDWSSNASVIERARKYLSKLPSAISGQGGHNAAFTAACSLVCGFGLGECDATNLFDEWNMTCQPPWSRSEVAHKIKSAGQQPGQKNYLRDAAPEQWERIRIPKFIEARAKALPADRCLPDEVDKRLAKIEAGEAQLVRLGLPELNGALGGGVAQGEMVVLAARPGHGKSAIALQCVHQASELGLPCLIVSEEMSCQALANRSIQWASDVPESSWRSRIGLVREHMAEHFRGRAPVRVVESTRSVDVAAEVIRRAVADYGVKFVAVDYAQHLSGEGKSRYEQASNVSKVLREVATEHQIVLLTLCQMNREILNRKKFIPMLSDIKDTGSFEQDADVILFSCWPHRLGTEHDPKEYLIFVAKNRHRPIVAPMVQCVFEPARQMFVECPQNDPFAGAERELAFDSFNE